MKKEIKSMTNDEFINMLHRNGNIIDHTKDESDPKKENYENYEEELYTVNGIPSPLHFYFLNKNLISGTVRIKDSDGVEANAPRSRCLGPIAKSSVILAVIYAPFLDVQRLILQKHHYDQDHYGTLASDPKHPEGKTVIGGYVYKITGIKRYGDSIQPQDYIDYHLNKVEKYPRNKFKQNKKRHWSNESKLFQYPYHYINIYDYFNAPLQVPVDTIQTSDKTFDVKVRQTLSISGSYTLYVPYLKGDAKGKLEGLKSVSPMDLPVSSSVYSQYIANNKAQHTTNNVMAFGNALLGQSGRLQASFNGLGQAYGQATMKDSIIDASYPDQFGNTIGKSKIINNSSVRSAGRKKLAGIAMDAVTEVGSRLWNAAGVIAQAQAKKTDMMNAPRNVTLQGGDVMDSITNGDRNIEAIRYHIKEEYLQRLGDYFAMYGYKQNKMIPINLRSRRDYNYIKTISANITGTIPKKHIESLKAIFNNGITLWHIDRNGGKFIDYSDDNIEV